MDTLLKDPRGLILFRVDYYKNGVYDEILETMEFRRTIIVLILNYGASLGSCNTMVVCSALRALNLAYVSNRLLFISSQHHSAVVAWRLVALVCTKSHIISLSKNLFFNFFC